MTKLFFCVFCCYVMVTAVNYSLSSLSMFSNFTVHSSTIRNSEDIFTNRKMIHESLTTLFQWVYGLILMISVLLLYNNFTIISEKLWYRDKPEIYDMYLWQKCLQLEQPSPECHRAYNPSNNISCLNKNCANLSFALSLSNMNRFQ